MISERFLDTIFDLKYFAVEVTCVKNDLTFNVIPAEEDIDASLQDFHIISTGSKYLIKTTDIYRCELEEDSEVIMKDINYIIKSFKGRLDGTTEIVMENRD